MSEWILNKEVLKLEPGESVFMRTFEIKNHNAKSAHLTKLFLECIDCEGIVDGIEVRRLRDEEIVSDR